MFKEIFLLLLKMNVADVTVKFSLGENDIARIQAKTEQGGKDTTHQKRAEGKHRLVHTVLHMNKISD